MNERPTSPSGDESEQGFSEKLPEEPRVEQREGNKLDDFVIETRVFLPSYEGAKGTTILYYDAIALEQAITNGSLPESELLFGRDSLEKRMVKEEALLRKELEQEAEFREKERFPERGPAPDKYLNELRAMYAENKNYIEIADNTELIISDETKEALFTSFINWMQLHESDIWFDMQRKAGEQHPTPEKLRELLINSETDSALLTRIWLEITLDYPTISHGMRIRPIRENNDGGFSQALMFFYHGRPLPNKTHIQTDILSALRVAGHFKKRGHGVSLPFGSSTKGSGDEKVFFEHEAT